MDGSLIGTIVTGLFSVLAVVITNRSSAKDMDHKLDKHQAITDTKLESLTEEVKKHNNFAQKIPVLEERISVANHRIDDLERIVNK